MRRIDYREDLGTWESDPENNARIIEQLRSGNGALDQEDDETLAAAALVGLITVPYRNPTKVELRGSLSAIGATGYGLKRYSHLNYRELLRYHREVTSELRNKTRTRLPRILAEIDKKNRIIVNEQHHY